MNSPARILICVVFIFVLVVPAWAEDYKIRSGEMVTLPAGNVTTVMVGNSSIIQVEATNNDTILLVRGIRTGRSDLKIVFNDGRQETHSFLVRGGSSGGGRGQVDAMEVEALLEGIQGITVRQAGSKVIIDGQIMSEEDGRRINMVANEVYSGGVVVMASTDFQTLKHEDNVLVEFQLVEVQKGDGGQLGMKWGRLLSSTSVDIGGQGGSGSSPTGSINIHAGVDGFIQAMTTDGFAKIHDTHRIVTLNGKEANYLAGGEVGFRNVGPETADVEYKEFGTKIDVTPLIDKAGNMRIQLDAEISALAGAGPDGVPNITKKKITNTVRLREGQSLALSGMVTRVGREDVERLPALGSIPALGALFSSKDFQKGKTEAVIFITAKRIQADDRTNIEMIKKPQIHYDSVDENWWERK
ncbi:MAG: pilus assembly protein N-terminal domain-containing protein [Deltaproteobacteria bacterium]|nr:pilus assembly protein N-terminal domain-containing protein [Deltaproteobacteria bacterium]